jgi:tetratricopeptide (TPR) repeat protein
MSDFPSALSLHQAGRMKQAEAAYGAVLAAEPDHAEALHALGVLRHQTGDSAAAAVLLARAATLDPGRAEFRFNHGLALLILRRLPEAMAQFKAAIAARPGWPEAHFNLGNAQFAQAAWQDAAQSFRQALRLRPAYVEAQVNLGNALKNAGKPDQAANAYRRARQLNPNQPHVHHNLAALLLDQGDLAGAEAGFRQALALDGNFLDSLLALAALLPSRNRHADAIPVLRAALRHRSTDPALHERLADSLRALDRIEEAASAYRFAIELSPDRLSARFGLAEALRKSHDFAGALAELAAVQAIRPGAWQTQHDIGNVHREMGDFAGAEAAYRAALAISETPAALNHLGAVLRDQGRIEAALDALHRALALDPGCEDARYNLALAHLSAGRLEQGFAAYESRFAKFEGKRPAGRVWTGERLAGKTLLVHAEQGLGDTLQFSRYLPLLAKAGAGQIVFQVQPSLLRLFAGFPGADSLVATDHKAPAYDCHAALMSLPHVLRCWNPAPIAIPYLAAPPDIKTAFKKQLELQPGPRIGLAWAGNPGFPADHLRSVAPRLLAPLAEIPACFVSLQKAGGRATVLSSTAPPFQLLDWTGELTDMADTAGLVANLDLVITVDTAIAHLAGAMGKPVWLLNRFDSCWRWQFETETTPWYPSLRQFRQDRSGDWAGVIHRVRDALAEEFHLWPSRATAQPARDGNG